MIYLASPYHHADVNEMQYRFECVCNAVVRLMQQGHVVYSPIAHNHYLAQNFSLPRDWSFWERFDLHMIDKADEVWVLQLDSWHLSTGIQAETIYAIATGKPVIYIEYEGEYGGEDNQHSGN